MRNRVSPVDGKANQDGRNKNDNERFQIAHSKIVERENVNVSMPVMMQPATREILPLDKM